MRLVADENVDKQIVDRLRADGHEVVYVAELDPGIDDEAVLSFSRESTAILITADKDFGELVFRQQLLHTGVVLIRLGGLTAEQKATAVTAMIDSHEDELSGRVCCPFRPGAAHSQVTQKPCARKGGGCAERTDAAFHRPCCYNVLLCQ